MKTAIITGSCGLVGSEAALRLHADGWRIVGIDNDMRRYFFGDDASTNPQRLRLEKALSNYHHHSLDIRDMAAVEKVFATGTEGGEFRRLTMDSQANAITIEGDEAGQIARREVDDAEARGVVDDGGVARKGGGVGGHGRLQWAGVS